MFFDDHPRFLTTSHTRSELGRLNLRHQAIIGANRDVIEGARILDLGSHDGRWTFAAVKAGAAHVVGIEARPELVANAFETFAEARIDRARYEFVTGDMFRVLAERRFEVDTVLCLGFLYHTLRYNELFHRIASTGASHLVIDSTVAAKRAEPLIELQRDNSANEGAAFADEYAPGRRVLVGVPSVAAIELLATSYGFGVTSRYDWKALIASQDQPRETAGTQPSGVRDYKVGKRVTLRAERRQ